MPMLDDLPLVKSVLLYYAGAACAYALYLAAIAVWRWRKRLPISQRGDTRSVFEDLCFYMWLCSFLAIPDLWHRAWDRTSWGEVAIVLAMTGVLMQIFSTLGARRRAERQTLAHANPQVDPSSPPPPVPVDWRNELRMGALLVPPLVCYIGGAITLSQLSRAGEWSMASTWLAMAAWLIGVPLLIMFARWPFTIRQRHTLVIKASPHVVWDTLHCRATDNYYRAPTARIEQVPGTHNKFVWHYGDLGPCPSCGLPKGRRSNPENRMLVEVVEQQENRGARQISTFPDDTPPACRMHLREENRFAILPHRDGAEVTYEVLAVGARLWVAGLMLVGNVPRDLLEDLKAHMEGTRSKGVFGSGREHRAHADAAPMQCGCT